MKRTLAILTVLAFVLGASAVVYANTSLEGTVPSTIGTNPGQATGYQSQTGANGDLLTIWNSYHNLSSYATTSPIHATSNTEVCVFCHTPHQAVTSNVLWNRVESPWGATVTNPTGTSDGGTSVTVDFGYLLETGTLGAPGPNGTLGSMYNGINLDPESLRCMTCHDGYTAVGQVAWAYTANGVGAQTIPMTGGNNGVINTTGFFFGAGGAGTDGSYNMEGNHPVSVPYSGSTYNNMTSQSGNFVTDQTVNAGYNYLKGVQGQYYIACTSCHDVHAQEDPANSSDLPTHLAQLIRVGTNGSALCVTCHER